MDRCDKDGSRRIEKGEFQLYFDSICKDSYRFHKQLATKKEAARVKEAAEQAAALQAEAQWQKAWPTAVQIFHDADACGTKDGQLTKEVSSPLPTTN